MIRVRIRTATVISRLARSGLTQADFAREVGVTSGFVSQLLAGVRHPGPATRERILDAPCMKGFDFDDLFEVEVAA